MRRHTTAIVTLAAFLASVMGAPVSALLSDSDPTEECCCCCCIVEHTTHSENVLSDDSQCGCSYEEAELPATPGSALVRTAKENRDSIALPRAIPDKSYDTNYSIEFPTGYHPSDNPPRGSPTYHLNCALLI